MGELFEKIKVNSLKYKTSEIPSIPKDEFILPALTAGIQNQGLNNYVPKDNATILKNVITISANGANTGATFFQNKEFTVLQDAYAIKWVYTDDVLTDNNYLFLVCAISKRIYGNYEWTNKAGWERIKSEKIHLPTQNGQIDFAFMEQFIAELEAERIVELEAYLRVTGLSDYILTEEERAVLEAFRSGKISWGGVKLLNNQQVANIEWKMFRIGELFEINSYKKRFDANKVQIEEVGFPYVVRTALNNGIRGYINEDVEFLNEGNTISFGQDTATMFYQEKPYFTGDKIKIVKCKDESFNKLNAHFFIAAMGKAFSSFSWGSSSFSVEIIKNQNISLPSTQGVPLYAYMEVFIRAVQKLVIKEVVEYADRKIAGTKEIVNY